MTPTGERPARRVRSTAASVWPGPGQHAAVAGAQRQDVPGTDEVGGRRVDVGEHPDGVQAVGGADAGRHTRGGVDRDRVGGAQRVAVLGDHERQLEPVGDSSGIGAQR